MSNPAISLKSKTHPGRLYNEWYRVVARTRAHEQHPYNRVMYTTQAAAKAELRAQSGKGLMVQPFTYMVWDNGAELRGFPGETAKQVMRKWEGRDL